MKRIIIFFFFAFLASLCSASGEPFVKVLYFHSQIRCKTCIAIEDETKKTVEENFSRELKSGKLIFEIIDISKSENESIADKYRITFSSLLIVKNEDSKEEVLNLTRFAFANARHNPQLLRGEIVNTVNNFFKPDGK